jgi:hypothetical protein
MDHGDYSYDGKNDFFGGIKIINSDEQIALINQASVSSEVNIKRMTIHQENYRRYEVDGEIKHGLKTQWIREKVEGYCQIYNNIHGKRYSVSPHCSFNCVECLSMSLVYNRAFQPGCDVEIDIPKPNGPGIDINELTKVHIRLNRGSCELMLDQHGIVKTNEFVFKIRPGKIPLLTLVGCRRGNSVYYGKRSATMLGLPICKSLLMGQPCHGQNQVSKDFFVNAVPRFYPGWTEIQHEVNRDGKTRPVGKIWVHSKCKFCTDFEQHKPDPVREMVIDDNMVKNRDKMILSLMTENEKLREQAREYAIQIDKLREELMSKNEK